MLRNRLLVRILYGQKGETMIKKKYICDVCGVSCDERDMAHAAIVKHYYAQGLADVLNEGETIELDMCPMCVRKLSNEPFPYDPMGR